MASSKGSRKELRKQPSKYGRGKKVAIEDEFIRNDHYDDLVHKVLPEDLMNELMGLTDVKNIESKLAGHFNLFNGAYDLKDGATLDAYTAAIWWGLQQKLPVNQLSGFFTIIYNLIENVKEKNMSLVENMLEWRNMVVLSQKKPELFSVSQCQAINDYIHLSFLQHYKLFEFMYKVAQAEEIIGADLTVEVLPPLTLPYPCPLCEAVSLDTYEDYIAAPPLATTPEVTKVEEEKPESPTIFDTDILDTITAEDVSEVFNEVSKALLSNVESNIRERIIAKENEYLIRINKIHNVMT